MSERIDEEKLAQIRAWAEVMLADERAESRAAARGLLLLADEIELLWEASRNARGVKSVAARSAVPLTTRHRRTEEPLSVLRHLHERLGRRNVARPGLDGERLGGRRVDGTVTGGNRRGAEC